MHDFLPQKAERAARLENIARTVFACFGYREIRTPTMENAALFERAIGQATDIVEKEMFSLKDRGERLLCLRPEGTAGVVRAFIEHHLDQESALQKLFYIAPMFRAERPQAGRYREFYQIGGEYFGDKSSAADAETIVLLSTLLSKLGVHHPEIRLNSIGCENCRPMYQEKLLAFLAEKKENLCGDCRRRMEKNPLRALDCKTDQAQFELAPCSLDHLCAECLRHHEEVLSYLDAGKICYRINRRLVRGLDYYTRTVFELYAAAKNGALATGATDSIGATSLTGATFAAEGSQDALAAGGRYDQLVRNLGGPQMPAIGFAMGLERVLNFLEANAETDGAAAENVSRGVFICAMGDGTLKKAFELLQQLRSKDIRSSAVLDNRSLKSQMRLANNWNARYCLILGEDEVKQNQVTIKDLQLHTQETVAAEQIFSKIL